MFNFLTSYQGLALGTPKIPANILQNSKEMDQDFTKMDKDFTKIKKNDQDASQNGLNSAA